MIKSIILFTIYFLAAYAPAQIMESVRVLDPISEWRSIKSVIANKSVSPEWRDDRGYSAAYYQLLYGSEKRAVELVSRAHRKKIWIEGKNERLLEVAIRHKSQAVVMALIKHGDLAASIDDNGFNPIQLAASMGLNEIVRILLQAGADGYCSKCGNGSPMEAALTNGHWKTALLLTDYGITLQKYLNKDRQGELMFRAIESDSLPEFIMLINLGFDIDVRNSAGISVFEYALNRKSPNDIIDILLNYPIDACTKNPQGERALDVAVRLKASQETISDFDLNKLRIRTSKCAETNQY